MEILDEINAIVDTYNGYPEDYSNINEIMYLRKKLSTYLVSFAVEVGNARKEWKTAEMRHEIIKNELRIKNQSLGTTKADWYAKVNSESENEESILTESVYWQLHYIFNSVREVLSEMNQRISYLREEEKQSKYFDE